MERSASSRLDSTMERSASSRLDARMERSASSRLDPQVERSASSRLDARMERSASSRLDVTMERSASSRLDMPSDSSFLREGDALDDDAETNALLEPFLRKPNVMQPRTGQENVPVLTRSDSRAGSWSPYLRELHMLSFAFLFVFLAYCAIQNLESSINTDQGLGSAALGVLYLSLTVSSLGAPMVVMRLGSKNSLILGLSGYWAFIVANFYASWYTLIPASIFLGFTASVLWVAEGTYLTFAAKAHAALCNISEATALGNFNGEFWSIFSLNQVVGNLLTLALLQFGKEAGTSSDSSSSRTLFVAFLGSMAIGSILMFLLGSHRDTKRLPSTRNDAVSPVAPQRQLASASFALLSEKKMLLLIFLLFYTGMQQAFIWGDFTKDVITSTLGLSWIGGIMAAYGAADTLGSFVAGRISSGLFSITIILCGGAVCQILVMAGLSLTYDGHASKELMDFVIIFAAAVVWGLGDATFNTQISAVLGILYPRDIEAAFAQWKIWQSVGTSVVFFASPYATFTAKLSVLCFSLLVSMGLFFTAIVRSSRNSV